MSKPKKKRGNSVVGTIFVCVIFLLIAALMVYNLLLGFIGQEVIARVTDMNTGEESNDGDRTYSLTVSYEFMLGGETYTGSGTYSSQKPIGSIYMLFSDAEPVDNDLSTRPYDKSLYRSTRCSRVKPVIPAGVRAFWEGCRKNWVDEADEI